MYSQDRVDSQLADEQQQVQQYADHEDHQQYENENEVDYELHAQQQQHHDVEEEEDEQDGEYQDDQQELHLQQQQLLQQQQQQLQQFQEGSFNAGNEQQQQQEEIEQLIDQHQQAQAITASLQRLRMSEQEQGRVQEEEEQGQTEEGGEEEEEEEEEEGQQEEEVIVAPVIDLALFDESYRSFLSKIAGDQAFVDANYEEKIDILIEYATAPEVEYRLGSSIFLFELVYNFRESLTDSAISLILTNIYANILVYYENKDFYVVYSVLEIIALIGPHSVSFANIKLIASILIEEALPVLQEKAFLALINFSYPGYFALLDIANKDYNDISMFILNRLAQTEEIQLSVIIPSLQNDITLVGDNKKRVQSLCALNHSIPILVNLLNEGTLDRQLIVSTIRAAGEIGEATLLKMLKQTTNAKIKMAISTVLSWHVRNGAKSALEISIVPYNISDHYNVNPGTMCVYNGNMTPLAFVDVEEKDEVSTGNVSTAGGATEGQGKANLSDFIEINSRDFMAALQRLLAVKYDKFSSEREQFDEDSKQYHDVSAFASQFTLIQLIDPADEAEEQSKSLKPVISQNIIKALVGLLSDANVTVRETAVSTLGLIGLPEVESAVDSLYGALQDPDSQVRAMAAWCLGRVGEANPIKVGKRLVSLLRDNYWKVRTAACVSLGSMGPSVSEIAFPALTKVLKDGTINKVTVCESLVRLGIQGEQILVDLLKTVPQADFKVKTAIIQSFELANITRPTIDFVIEELFKNSNDKIIEVRRACLQTLEILRNRALDSNITYLKSKNVLPLFYFFLADANSEIREMALASILSFGPQAEFMLIEGLTKDKNPLIRQECAKGLGQLGVQNIRALIFGLRDINEEVRRITGLVVKQFFTAESIIEEFKDQQNLLPQLFSSIKDVFNLPFYLDEDCRVIFEQILNAFGEQFTFHPAALSQTPTGYQKNSNYSFEQHANQQSVQESQKSSSSKKFHSATRVPAQKLMKNIPNMRGGMPAYTSYKPGTLVNQFS